MMSCKFTLQCCRGGRRRNKEGDGKQRQMAEVNWLSRGELQR